MPAHVDPGACGRPGEGGTGNHPCKVKGVEADLSPAGSASVCEAWAGLSVQLPAPRGPGSAESDRQATPTAHIPPGACSAACGQRPMSSLQQHQLAQVTRPASGLPSRGWGVGTALYVSRGSHAHPGDQAGTAPPPWWGSPGAWTRAPPSGHRPASPQSTRLEAVLGQQGLTSCLLPLCSCCEAPPRAGEGDPPHPRSSLGSPLAPAGFISGLWVLITPAAARVFSDPLPHKGGPLSVWRGPAPSPVKGPLEWSPPPEGRGFCAAAGPPPQLPQPPRSPQAPPHPALSLQGLFRTMRAVFSRAPLGPPRPPSAQTEGPCRGSSPAEHRPQP